MSKGQSTATIEASAPAVPEKKAKRTKNNPLEYKRLYIDEGIKNLDEIARICGVSRSAVYYGLRVNQVQFQRGKKSIEISKKDLLDELNSPENRSSLTAVCQKLDIAPATLYKLMKEHGIERIVRFK